MSKDYDTRGVNWARLVERVMAGVINTIVYGTVILLAHLFGLF